MSTFDDSVLKRNTYRSVIINMKQVPKLVKIEGEQKDYVEMQVTGLHQTGPSVIFGKAVRAWVCA